MCYSRLVLKSAGSPPLLSTATFYQWTPDTNILSLYTGSIRSQAALKLELEESAHRFFAASQLPPSSISFFLSAKLAVSETHFQDHATETRHFLRHCLEDLPKVFRVTCINWIIQGFGRLGQVAQQGAQTAAHFLGHRRRLVQQGTVEDEQGVSVAHVLCSLLHQAQ